jgi:mono/diheme cytochrome c family protein
MRLLLFAFACLMLFAGAGLLPGQEKKKYLESINVEIPHVSTDKSVRYDYDIVYVRAQRAGDKVHKRFYTDFSAPVTIEPGADLMLLRPDGKEELLVAGGKGSITDPFVAFDGQWVYYTHLHDMQKASQWNPPREGADIFKIHVPTKKIVRLTNQQFAPNTGAAPWSKDFRTPEKGKSHIETGVYNMGACPLPGGKIVFTSNQGGFRPAKGYPAIALQLFVMDDRGTSIGDDENPTNLEKIGHLNISGALHPVVLMDGRIMYSTLESQGGRGDILWGIWTIHPDGTNWNPLVSAFDPGGAPNGFHFQTQLSGSDLVIEEYYNQNNSGFGAYVKVPSAPPGRSPFSRDPAIEQAARLASLKHYTAFGPAYMNDPRNQPWRMGRHDNGTPRYYRMPFMPTGAVAMTPFALGLEGPADRSIRGDKTSSAVGKVTHPSGAPDNHLLTVYSPGPVNHQYTYLPQLDGGIYLIKNGDVVEEPGEGMLLIKNDPNYNECWPRALVPYERIYGMKQPSTPPRLANDGALSKHLPAGTPYGLVGTSSFYKRESYPNGVVPKGSVTATYAGGNDPWKGLDAFTSHGNGMPLNWHNQGADAGLYTNDDIHAVRILVMEPTTMRSGAVSGRRFYNHARERLRVLGEIPLRDFSGQLSAISGQPEQKADGRKLTADGQPLDPDGNPDTSFLAKIPADTAFTFQTIDKRGLVLNSAQTWHQLRPGEMRVNCGGCHAHSQQPTPFEEARAARPDYPVWDLTAATPLIVDKERDESKRRWDVAGETGVRTVKDGPVNVEYHRDIRPILNRSCVACHTSKEGAAPVGNLDLDADHEQVQYSHEGKFPGTYYRLALDQGAKFGHKPIGYDSWGYPNASRYVRQFQARRSLLMWKLFGERLDGFTNDDHPSETKPGARAFSQRGQEVSVDKARARYDLDYLPPQMPPPDAVKAGKVAPLSDEDKRTIARWIDLGCPIDLDYDAKRPERVGYGWMLDEQRPTLALALPAAGRNAELSRILIGMDDYGSGLDAKSLRVVAGFAVDGVPAGADLAAKFRPVTQGVWELRLPQPMNKLPRGKLAVSVADRQGNVNRVERTFSVGGDESVTIPSNR